MEIGDPYKDFCVLDQVDANANARKRLSYFLFSFLFFFFFFFPSSSCVDLGTFSIMQLLDW